MDSFGDLSQLAETHEAPRVKRQSCARCCRPLPTCWCPWLPQDPIDIATKVIILQHPYEDRRKLQTARMLQLAVTPGRVEIWRGRRFAQHRRRAELEAPGCAVLYPADFAREPSDLPAGAVRTLIVLDGTWQQASGLRYNNEFLHRLPHLRVSAAAAAAATASVSAYVIRTQPDAGCLCTAEAAALALDGLERRADVLPAVLGPIGALCRFQMDWGAVAHADKRTKRRLLAAEAGAAEAGASDGVSA